MENRVWENNGLQQLEYRVRKMAKKIDVSRSLKRMMRERIPKKIRKDNPVEEGQKKAG